MWIWFAWRFGQLHRKYFLPSLRLFLLAEEASEEFIKKLMTYVHEPERLVIMGKEIYLHCPNGYGKSKLSNNFIENKLKVQATTRNWRSVVKTFGLFSVSY